MNCAQCPKLSGADTIGAEVVEEVLWINLLEDIEASREEARLFVAGEGASNLRRALDVLSIIHEACRPDRGAFTANTIREINPPD